MAVIEITKENFEAEVLKSEVPVLADFNRIFLFADKKAV